MKSIRLYILLVVASFALVVGCKKADDSLTQPEEETSSEELLEIDYSRYAVIDFDEEYGKCSGAELVKNLNKAISSADEDSLTMILMKSVNYDFDNNTLSIAKGVMLSGAIPSSIDNEKRGAQRIATTLSNVKQILVRSDNTTLANLKIVDEKTNTYGTIAINASNGKLTTGVVFYNIEIQNGATQILGRYGAGVTCQNCTFRDFTRAGYLANRSEDLDEMPKCVFLNSLFYPNEKLANFNTRGLSFDAGNTEYPVVWDLQGTVIQNSLFHHNGVGFSKACNVKILNNEFTGNTLYREMFHAEEFSRDMLIKGNTFIYEKLSRGIYIDRERQNAANIRIVNNKFKGQIGWVISSYSPQGLVFEGNDFTEARFTPSSEYTHFEFSYYANEAESKYVPYEVATKGLIMRNNKGLSGFTMNIFVEEGDNSNVIEESGDITKTTVPAVAPIIENGVYKLKSKSGQYIALSSAGDVVTLLTSLKLSFGICSSMNFKTTP